jgi:hypothetical protein
MLFAIAVILALVALVLVTGNVSAGDPSGGVHGIIRALL